MRRRTWITNIALVLGILAVAALVVGVLRPAPQETPLRTAVVERGDVISTVTASGSVTTPGVVDLSFPIPGTVTLLAVDPGDRVRTGQLLAEIDSTMAEQQVAAAESALAQAEAAAFGSTTSVQSASEALDTARRAQRAADARLDQAVRQAREGLLAARDLWSPACADASRNSCPNPSAAAVVGAAQGAVDAAQVAYDLARAQATAAPGDAGANQAASTAEASLTSAQATLERTVTDLRRAGQDAVRVARQALESAQSTRRLGRIQNAQAVQAAEAALAAAQASTGAGAARPADTAVTAAQSALVSAQTALEQTRLVAPIAGIVGGSTLVLGQSSAVGVPAPNLSIVPARVPEVVAGFAESDAADIATNDAALVSFEALPGFSVDGSVVAIDPLPTTSLTGLVSYGVRIGLADLPAGLRQGMTASVSIVVDQATDVLRVPQGAIVTTDAVSTVEVLADDDTRGTVEVTLGIRGDTDTEITSGLVEGQTVVIPSADDGVGLTFPSGGVPGSRRTSGGSG